METEAKSDPLRRGGFTRYSIWIQADWVIQVTPIEQLDHQAPAVYLFRLEPSSPGAVGSLLRKLDSATGLNGRPVVYETFLTSKGGTPRKTNGTPRQNYETTDLIFTCTFSL
jgi:hypothetical protein